MTDGPRICLLSAGHSGGSLRRALEGRGCLVEEAASASDLVRRVEGCAVAVVIEGISFGPRDAQAVLDAGAHIVLSAPAVPSGMPQGVVFIKNTASPATLLEAVRAEADKHAHEGRQAVISSGVHGISPAHEGDALVWVDDADGYRVLGINIVAHMASGRMMSVQVVPALKEVKAGEPFARLHLDGREVVDLLSPVGGRVAGINHEAGDALERAMKEGFREAWRLWLVRIAP